MVLANLYQARHQIMMQSGEGCPKNTLRGVFHLFNENEPVE